MINKGVTKFVEIGPGKVLSGLVKRIDRSVTIVSINELDDLQGVKLND
jgi:[acyl-carrier-protein] S-malonyltransferase